MAVVTLLHSAYGLRPAVLADAERLRAAGHEVRTPDLYGGEVFDDLDSGMAHKDALGQEELLARARTAVADAGPGHVYAGYSLGASFAQLLVEGRPDAGAAFFLGHADGPWTVESWPAVPTQAHVARGDEWVDDAEAARAAGIEVFEYDGGHLFTDPDLPDHDAPSAALVWERVLALLARV